MENFTQKRFQKTNLLFLSTGLRKNILSLSILFIALFSGLFANAQTDRLPTTAGDGGFDNGNPSGWTIQNSAAANTKRWLIGTTATTGFTGTYSAFIRTTTGTAHSYTVNATPSARISRDIVLPSGETNITLSFKWICGGELADDRLRVWVMPSTTTLPAIGIGLSASGTVPTGIEEITNGGGNFSGNAAPNPWTTFSVKLNPLYAGTTIKLLFEWINDGDATVTQPPAGIDDVSLTTCVPPTNDSCNGTALTVNPTSTPTTCTAGTTVNALASAVAVCTGNADDDVWYQFTATKTSHIVTVTPSGGTPISDAVFQVFSTSCGGTSIACENSTGGAAAETNTLTGLSVGATYYVRVYSNANNTGQGTFTICVTTPNCTAPASQAGFTPGTVTTTAYPGTITGTADGFLVIQSTSATPPSQPVDGTLYTTTASISGLGSGLTFVQSGASTAIAGTGLTSNTHYYYYIYAYTVGTTGCAGPIYKTGGAGGGNATTCADVPTGVAAGSITNNGCTMGWTAAAVGGSASAITYTVIITSDPGYATHVASSPYTGISGVSQIVSGLSPGTLYYYRVYATNGCSSTNVDGSFTTTNVAVCTPNSTNCAFSNPTNMDIITNVTINSLNNSSSACSAGGYIVYPPTGTQTTSLLKGTSYNLSVTLGNGSGGHGVAVWFDFNQNGVFTDAGEYFLIGNAIGPSTTTTISIPIPVGANTGSVVMRVRNLFFTTITSAMSCTSTATLGETEDYTITLIPPTACTPPSLQPTVLNLTPSGTTINGSFTASAGSADSYLVVVSTNNTASPTVPSGSYTIGATLSAGYTVVDNDANTSFSATGLSASTLYYFYVYSMNSLCTGGPLYVTASPLSGSATTGTPSYCTPTGTTNCAFSASDMDVITNVTINTLNNSSSCSAGGYTAYTGGGTETTSLLKGGAYQFSLTMGNGSGSHGVGVWFDFNKDGDFDDAGEFYLVGNSIVANTTTTIPIYVPTTTPSGTIAMRVRLAFNQSVTSTMSCTIATTLGETEDYTVTIVTPTACSATTLACGATLAGTTVGSTDYFPNTTGCSQLNFGTLYSFVGDGQQSVISVTSTLDMTVSVSNGTCGVSLTNMECVDDYFGGATAEVSSFNTTAGVTYYIFVSYFDVAGTYANIGPFSITRTCGPAYNPCSSIATVTCGTVNTVTVPAGYGVYNHACSGWPTTGKELIYSFTPATTGSYYIAQTAGYGYIYYEYKLASAGCSNTGWTCINGLSGVITSNAFTLTAGLAYYIRVDPETTAGGNISFAIAGKVWSGVTDNDWSKASNWIPNTSIPNGTDCVIIPNVTNKPIISGTNYNGLAGTLTIQPSSTLTVNSTNSITVTDKVTNNGTFTLNNNTSLVQVNNVANSGNIVYKRDSTVKLYDYVYWSSPVSGYTLNTIATPLSFTAMYKWVIPALNVTNSNGGQGSWVNASGDTMIAGKGYIAKVPSSFPTTPSTFNGTFTGVPNNGTITFPIERGDIMTTPNGIFPAAPFAGNNGIPITNLSDNWNLAGNPYPSAISGGQFLIDNNTKITGTIRLWKHGITPTSAVLNNPYYTSYNMNYDGNDYLTWNFSGSSCCPVGTDLYIGAGQGFFIQMLDGSRATDNVTFNNGLRSASYDNSLFYRSSNNNHTQASPLNIEHLERNRIWLDLNDGAGNANRTLFGYIEGATMGNDHFFDTVTSNGTSTQIYSIADNSKFTIQGRALPFNEQDEVPIGVDIKAAGNCMIGIGDVDGFFDTQAIYLKDNLLNITHDLKVSPYQFTAEVGIIDDRFKVIYTSSALQNPTFLLDNNIRAIVNNEVVAVSSNDFVMESIIVYNVLGQKLNTYNNINANYFSLTGLHKNNTTLLLKIKLQTGETVTRKVSY